MTSLSSRRLEQREKLLEAAYALVAEVGIEGLRTRDISKRAGLNLAIFHYCFVSKDDLLRALYQHIVTKFRAKTEHFLAECPTPTDQLEGLLKLRVFLTQHMSEDLKVWRGFQGLSEHNAAVRELLKEHFIVQRERISEVLQQGIDRGEFNNLPNDDVRTTASLVISLQNGMITQLGIDSNAFDPESYASAVFAWITGKPLRA